MSENKSSKDSGDESYEESSTFLLSESPGNNSLEEADIYERTVAACGFGWFQIKLLLVCGWGLASDSVEVQTVAFVISSACDLNLTSSEKGWLNAVIFFGMMIGGYCFGGAADVKGRRFILSISMTLNGLFGLASAFAPSYAFFLVFRLLSGVGVGAAMPVLFSYYVEFFSRDRRGPFIGFLASWWMVGNFATAALAWAVIPHVHFGMYIFGMWFGNWRIFAALCALPSITSAIFFLSMPESPKYLQKVQRFEEAEKVFEKMFKANHYIETPIPPEIRNFAADQQRNSRWDNTTYDTSSMCMFSQCLYALIRTLSKVLGRTKRLFQKPYLNATIVLIIIWFTLSFGYYGLWMWFPEIFRRIKDGRSSCGGTISNETISRRVLNCTEQVEQDSEVYFESFVIAISNLPGNIFTILVINRLGRRFLLALSMVLSGISVFFFWFVTTTTEMLIMSCIFSGLSVAGWNALDALALEQYATDLRSTAFGFHASLGRVAAVLGNVTFGGLVDVHCSIPLLLVAVFLFAGGLSVFRLKDTDQNALK